jgi:NADH-quinone oxidoreductase subunit L
VLAGYVGVPHALGGENRIHDFLESSFHPASAGDAAAHGAAAEHGAGGGAAAVGDHGAEAAHAAEQTELTLMGVSSAIALLGIGIAAWFFLFNRALADSVARSFAAVHATLLHKYWIDELYDAAIVQPLKKLSDHVLWKVVDIWIIDGVVNGVGIFVRGSAALMRMVQTGSIRTYAASLVLGVVLVLGYYLMR